MIWYYNNNKYLFSNQTRVTNKNEHEYKQERMYLET